MCFYHYDNNDAMMWDDNDSRNLWYMYVFIYHLLLFLLTIQWFLASFLSLLLRHDNIGWQQQLELMVCCVCQLLLFFLTNYSVIFSFLPSTTTTVTWRHEMTTTMRCGMTTTTGAYGMSFFIYHLLLFPPNCSYSVDLRFLPLPLQRKDVG